jgi:hypothetical protein
MHKYVIEREIPGVGQFTDEDFKGISQKSCSVLKDLGANIQWLHSYVTANKIYCIYQATGEDVIKRHADQGGFPANSISRVFSVIDPTSAQ